MPDNQTEVPIGVTQPDAFEQTTTGEAVTAQRIFAGGGDGKEKEATVFSPHAGASSDVPYSSGIPSAMTQQRLRGAPPEDQPETPLGDRILPTTQNLEP